MSKDKRRKKILHEGNAKENLQSVKSKYGCSLGDDGGWCDGVKSSRCAFCNYVVNAAANACGLGM